jgi:hypothetical protein
MFEELDFAEIETKLSELHPSMELKDAEEAEAEVEVETESEAEAEEAEAEAEDGDSLERIAVLE